MIYPNLSEEKKLWKKGYKFIACLDEAGRGPLAGPVVAATVMMKNPKSEIRNSKQYLNSKFKCPKRVSNFVLRASNLRFRDSKKLSAKKREEFYKIITRYPALRWGIGIVSEKVIDRINILEATKLAMRKAIAKLKKKPDFLILDGNFTLPAEALAKAGIKKSVIQKSIIKADEKVFSCAAASIIAKVTRDKIMMRYHKKYPQYGFNKHKGYPTKLHYAMLKLHGPCQIHRKSFKL